MRSRHTIPGKGGSVLRFSWKKLSEKLKESLNAVLPIVGIVVVLSFTVAPITSSTLLS